MKIYLPKRARWFTFDPWWSLWLSLTVLTFMKVFVKWLITPTTYIVEVHKTLFQRVWVCANTSTRAFFEFRSRSGRKLLTIISGAQFWPFLAGNKSTFSDISRLRLKLRKSSRGAPDELFSENLRLWSLFHDFPFLRNSGWLSWYLIRIITFSWRLFFSVFDVLNLFCYFPWKWEI